jgi:hypothetical protein
MIKSLQKVFFLPSLYAFHGTNDLEREITAVKTIRICSNVFESRGRGDIEFINQ